MAGRMEGKVALVTGAARGQGRSHAIRLAEEGADIIAVDICAQIPSVLYPMSTPEDLVETEKAVVGLGRRIHAAQADVRDREGLRAVVEAGIAELGHLDTVVANAGMMPLAVGDPDPMDFVDVTDVCFVGVMNTIAVSIPHLPEGSSIVVTGSLAARVEGATNNPTMGPGGDGYGWSKQTLGGLVQRYALHLAPRSIRVNAIHPANCNTHMLHNDGLYKVFRPDVENPTREDVEPVFYSMTAMPVPFIEPVDISNAVLYFASDESRYVTAQELVVDAGSYLKMKAH